jgi:hypothetical protein
VSKKWIARRIASAIESVLEPVGMGTVSQLLFVYEARRGHEAPAVVVVHLLTCSSAVACACTNTHSTRCGGDLATAV